MNGSEKNIVRFGAKKLVSKKEEVEESYTATHIMQILHNESDDFEAYCPQCGRHIFKKAGKWTFSRQGDFYARHLYPVRSRELGLKTMILE